MCKYCELEDKETTDLIFEHTDPECLVCIMKATPISLRKYPDYPGLLYIKSGISYQVPIKYCPICGRELC